MAGRTFYIFADKKKEEKIYFDFEVHKRLSMNGESINVNFTFKIFL